MNIHVWTDDRWDELEQLTVMLRQIESINSSTGVVDTLVSFRQFLESLARESWENSHPKEPT